LGDKEAKAHNAWIPIVVLVVSSLVALWYNGGGPCLGYSFDALREAFSNADSSMAILWATVFTVIVTILLALSQRILSLEETMDAFTEGAASMVPALMILTLAVGTFCSGTASVIGSFLSEFCHRNKLGNYGHCDASCHTTSLQREPQHIDISGWQRARWSHFRRSLLANIGHNYNGFHVFCLRPHCACKNSAALCSVSAIGLPRPVLSWWFY